MDNIKELIAKNIIYKYPPKKLSDNYLINKSYFI